MVKFLLYLFESGLCLTILFLVYIFFLRKETYFRFNRVYLISIIFFSLFIPFIHISFNVSNINKYEYPFQEIGKFRSYYEQLIAMTDPEYLNSPKKQNNLEIQEIDFFSYVNSNEKRSENSLGSSVNSIEKKEIIELKRKSNYSISKIIFTLYILGIIFFASRILFLFRWIYKTIITNQMEIRDEVKLVKVQGNLPPFSFLKFVFLNQDVISSNKADQILTHEMTHVKQMHSVDLLLAHLLSIFQWFNPFVWKLQKAIKTNHEYLADSYVVNKGYDLYNYQELLLNQFLSIRSVELVNNFNLISIKKRITMMNKVKSGFTAKLKALFIIPAALLVFFLFANLTIYGPEKALKNFSFLESQQNIEQLKGIWKNNAKDSYAYLIRFSENKFTVLEDEVNLKEYNYKIENNYLIINIPNSNPIALKYQISNNNIRIWWNDVNSSVFNKTEYKNSLDAFLAGNDLNISPPIAKNYKILERRDLCLFIAICENKVIVQDQVGKITDLEELIIKAKSTFNQLDLNLVTVQLATNINTPMKEVYKLHEILKKNNLLKIAYVCYPNEIETDLISPHTSFIYKLPPQNENQNINKNNLSAMSIAYYEINAANTENTPNKLAPEIKEFISTSEKYIMCLVYNNSITFNDYISYLDMVWTVVFDLRNQYALNKYNMNYDNLGTEFKQEIKKRYPIALTQFNKDEGEN